MAEPVTDPGAGVRRTARRPLRLLPALAALAVVALALALGTWQLRRADEKRALHARSVAAVSAEPVQVPGAPADVAGLDGRRVAARGRLLVDRSVFIDNRTRGGVAGFHVVSPVRLEGSDLHVLVLRGWVARDRLDRTRLPALVAVDAPVTVEGIAEATIAQALELRAAPPPGPDDRIWQNLDFDRYARWSGLRLQPVLVRQLADLPVDDGLARDWIAPGPDVDKHLGYAFQWFLLAAATAGLWIHFTFFRRRDHARTSA